MAAARTVARTQARPGDKLPRPHLKFHTYPCQPRSGERFHWRCDSGHTWEATIAQRTAKRSGCPYCSGRHCLPKKSLAALDQRKAQLWDHHKNTHLTPSQVSPGSGKRVHWKCRRGHEWKASVQAVVKNRGYCARCNSLALRYPDIARQ